MIHTEAWYKQALGDRQISNLSKRLERGDLNALQELGLIYWRTKKFPSLSKSTWAKVVEVLQGQVSKGGWIEHFLWKASQESGILPDVPKEAVDYIPFGLAPKVTYQISWEVLTAGSTESGDYEDLGMLSVDGDYVSFRTNSTETSHNFDHVSEIDDFLNDLENEGYEDVWDNGNLTKILNRASAQEEFGDTYNVDAYGGDVDPFYGESLATVIGGKYEIHIENEQHRQQIMKWFNEK